MSTISKNIGQNILKAPVLCDVDSFAPYENEEILVGISDIPFRNTLIDKLLKKNARF